MKKFSVALAAVLAIMLVPAASWAIGIEAAIGMWQQSPTGSLQYEGDSLDLGNDLGMGDDEKLMTGRLKVDMPGFIPNVYIMGTKMSFEGQNLNSNFTYGSYNYTTATRSELVLDHYDVALYYGVPFLSTLSDDKLNLEAGLNVRMLDISAKIESVSNVEEKSLTIAVPMLYVGLQIRPTDKFGFEFEGRGISYSGNSYYDAIARVKLKPVGPVFIAGGYRYQTLKVDEDDIVVDMTFEGPFLEAGFEF